MYLKISTTLWIGIRLANEAKLLPINAGGKKTPPKMIDIVLLIVAIQDPLKNKMDIPEAIKEMPTNTTSARNIEAKKYNISKNEIFTPSNIRNKNDIYIKVFIKEIKTGYACDNRTK